MAVTLQTKTQEKSRQSPISAVKGKQGDNSQVMGAQWWGLAGGGAGSGGLVMGAGDIAGELVLPVITRTQSI